MPHMRTRGGTQLQRPPAARPPPAATPPLPTWVTSRGTGLVWHWRMTDMVTGAMSSIVVTLSSQAEMKAVTSLHRSARGYSSEGCRHAQRQQVGSAGGRQAARPPPAAGRPDLSPARGGRSDSHEQQAQQDHPAAAQLDTPSSHKLKHACVGTHAWWQAG